MDLAWKYYLKALGSIVLVGILQILGMLYYAKLVMNLSADDFSELSLNLVAIVILLLLVFVAICLYIFRDLIRFLRALPEESSYSDEELLGLQKKLVNLGYWIAGVSFLFYLLSTPIIVQIFSARVSEWTPVQISYGVAGGFIAGLLNVPLALLITNMIAKPVLYRAFEFSSTLPRAARVGLRMSVRTKLIISMFILILTSLLYTSIVSYSRSREILESGKSIESELLRLGGAVKEGAKNEDGFQVHSMEYFESKTGSMLAFHGIVIAVCAVLGLIIAYMSAEEITRPVRELAAKTEGIIHGDLDQEIMLVGNDELAKLGAVYNLMLNRIKDQVYSVEVLRESITQAIHQLNQTSKLILEVSKEQSTGATEQAAAMQQTSSISAEIVATAKQIAERARHMDEAAGSTLGACKDGNSRLDGAVGGYENVRSQMLALSVFLKGLSERYQEMFKVVDMIEYIVEQTELLALNASLEAAGAGEAGRRFEIVASATRRLAARTGEAASDIRSIIESIKVDTDRASVMAGEGEQVVDQGRGLINQVIVALDDISNKARDTSTTVTEITMSTRQQTTASEQMAASVGEVSEVAEKMLEGAREIEASIAQLNALTVELTRMVDERWD